MTLQLRIVSRSEVGLVRKMNQDSGYASPQLLVVADGMGGAAAGDLASAVAVDEIRTLDTADLLAAGKTEPTETGSDTPAGSDDGTDGGSEDTVVVPEPGAAGRNPLLARFADAIRQANDRIADLVAADYTLEGMGTTVTGAIFDGSRLALAHIGDSRAYLLRDGRLEQLTHDHSWVQSLVDDGKISPDEAAYHPHRSLLLKVLNGQPANEPDLTTVALRAGDRVLFCSDGLSGMVDDEGVALLGSDPDLDTAVDKLVEAALAGGGIDNITVILAEAVELPPPGGVDSDDTAVRAGVGTAAVLGAALERDIPAVPRRSSVVPGFDEETDEDDDLDRDLDDEPSGPPPGGAGADDESRYDPRPPSRRRVLRTLLVGLVVVLIAGAGLGAGYAWTRTQYFVGADGDQVAIFSGLPESIPGLPLSQVYEVQQLPVASLPPYYQAQVATGIEVASLEAARATVAQLRDAAARCAPPLPSPTPTPNGGSTTATPGTTPRPTPTATLVGPTVPPASPTPTPTPTSPQDC